jgi:hypothetical protein
MGGWSRVDIISRRGGDGYYHHAASGMSASEVDVTQVNGRQEVKLRELNKSRMPG